METQPKPPMMSTEEFAQRVGLKPLENGGFIKNDILSASIEVRKRIANFSELPKEEQERLLEKAHALADDATEQVMGTSFSK